MPADENPCPECGGEMRLVCPLQSGDEEARGWTGLYQCRKCKYVEERS